MEVGVNNNAPPLLCCSSSSQTKQYRNITLIQMHTMCNWCIMMHCDLSDLLQLKPGLYILCVVQWTLVIVNAWIVNNLSLVNIFGETGRLFYNINYMLNSKHLSLVNKIGDKTEFTITRVHCICPNKVVSKPQNFLIAPSNVDVVPKLELNHTTRSDVTVSSISK